MTFCYEYARPMVCVDVALFVRRRMGDEGILLIQREREPYAGFWALPGGFIEMDEELEHAACRELYEETGVIVRELLQIGAFGSPQRDPRGRNISIAFSAMTEQVDNIQAGDDAVTARMFSLKALPALAFDHDIIIPSAIELLKLHQKW